MSIVDAKDPQSWQIGFDDGIKFGTNNIENNKWMIMSEWISVKDRLPEHQQAVLAYAITRDGKAGFGVAVFVDSIKMNEELMRSPYSSECVDVKTHPYYFVSQEQKQHTYNVVTHWMPLPEPPEKK